MWRSKSATRIARVPSRSSNHLLSWSRDHIKGALADLVRVNVQRTRGRAADHLSSQAGYAGMAGTNELLALLDPSIGASQVRAMRIENVDLVRHPHHPGRHLRILRHPSLCHASCDLDPLRSEE